MNDGPFTTKQACEALGCSRAWFNQNTDGHDPVMRLPGATGALLWSRATVDAIGERMGRTPTYSTVGGES